MTKKGNAHWKVQKCFMEKYHNSESYNDLSKYKRALNRATSKYKKAIFVCFYGRRCK